MLNTLSSSKGISSEEAKTFSQASTSSIEEQRYGVGTNSVDTREEHKHTNVSQQTKFVSNGAVQRAMDFLITTVISTSLLGAAVEVDAGLTDPHSQFP